MADDLPIYEQLVRGPRGFPRPADDPKARPKCAVATCGFERAETGEVCRLHQIFRPARRGNAQPH